MDNARLAQIADRQYGYFTYQQAISCGFDKANHTRYYVARGLWLKIDRGLFRLPGQPDGPDADFTRWFLWSRNQADQPQAVISHYSALVAHGLLAFAPGAVHLTVPVDFRKRLGEGVVLHKRSLPLSAVTPHPDPQGYIITRLAQTLIDTRAELTHQGRWADILARAIAAGRLTEGEIAVFGRPEMPAPGGDQPPADPACAQAGASASPGPEILGPTGQPPVEPVSSLSERVFAMLHERCAILRPPPLRRRREAGFTLVELLVVIAIISILAGLLLPTLEKSLTYARQAACQSNLRQLALFTRNYADETEDFLPSQQHTGSTWDPVLRQLDAFIGPSVPYKAGRSSPVANVFMCPAETQAWYGGWGPGCYSYAWNNYAAYRTDKWLKLAPIPRPAALPLMACANRGYGGDERKTYPEFRGELTMSYPNVGQNHYGDANFYFADFHVAFYPRRDWPAPTGSAIKEWFPWGQ